MSELKTILKEPRELSNDEWRILNKMTSEDFNDKDIILLQLKSAKVISYCPCGCKTIDVQVGHNLPKYKNNKRVPIELRTFSKDGIPIIASIHVVNGYINELEIIRADSKAIIEEIILDNAIIDIN